jgi:cytochrome c oxidase subunit IV
MSASSTDLHTHPGTPPEPHHQPREHEHPSDRSYVIVAAILAVITAFEVATYWWEDPETWMLISLLFPMMVAKFLIVCGWFMHLKFDNPLFRRIFFFGLILAVSVYMVALTSMQLFESV